MTDQNPEPKDNPPIPMRQKPGRVGFARSIWGKIKTFFAPEPQSVAEMKEDEIDDRFSNIFIETPRGARPRRKPNYSWKTRSLEPLPPEEGEEDFAGNGMVLYDAEGRVIGRAGGGDLAPGEIDEDDYMYREWMGLTRRLGPLPERDPVSEAPEPGKLFEIPEEEPAQPVKSEPTDLTEKAKALIFSSTDTSAPGDVDNDFEDMRGAFLEGIEEAETEAAQLVEIEEAVKERKRSRWGGLEVTLAVVAGLLVIGLTSVLIYGQRYPSTGMSVVPLEAPTSTAVDLQVQATASDIRVYPKELVLSPDQSFKLERSTIVDGQWKPKGPEWLDGNEVSRIIALPWSSDLEGVISTMATGSVIEVKFTNGTSLKYTIHSIEQVTISQSETIDTSRPSLIVFLYGANTPKRWVVTAYP